MKKFLCKSCNTYIDKIYDSIYGCSAGLDFDCKFSNYYDWLEMSFDKKKIYVTVYNIYNQIEILHLFPTERTNLELKLTKEESEFYLTHFYYRINLIDDLSEIFDDIYKKDFKEIIKDFKLVRFEDKDDVCYDFEHSSILYYLEDEIKQIENKIEKNLIFL